MKTSEKWLLLGALAFSSPLALSHEFWVTKKGSAFTLHSGHGLHSHGQAEETEYQRSFVQHVQCFNHEGRKRSPALSATYPLIIQGPCDAVFVDFSSGYWTKTPYGLKNKRKDQVKAPFESWLSKEYIKRLDLWSEALSLPLTSSLELVPLENPFPVKSGEKIRLQLTMEGKTIAACPVAYDGDTRGMTDETGRINIRIRHGGIQIIQASFIEPADGAESDKTVHTTTLIFQIPE